MPARDDQAPPHRDQGRRERRGAQEDRRRVPRAESMVNLDGAVKIVRVARDHDRADRPPARPPRDAR